MPKKFKNIILFLASMIFYFYGEPKYILLMILEILIAYIGGILIKKYKNKKMLFGIIIIHIIFLCFFKKWYCNYISVCYTVYRGKRKNSGLPTKKK